MKKCALLLASLFLLSCAGPNAEKIQSQFDDFLENYHEEGLKLYRLSATYMGDSRYNDTLPNYLAAEFIDKENAFFDKYDKALETFNSESLREDQVLSKALLRWELDREIEATKFDKNLMPIDQMWSFHLSFGQLASGAGAQPFKTVQDYNNWLIRLEGYLAWMRSAEENMQQGISKGWVLPKALIKKVLPQLQQMITDTPEEHLFYSPITNFPDGFSEEDKNSLTQAYKAVIRERIIPAYQRLYDFMATTYMEAGRTSSGFDALPNGADYYQHAITLYTTTTMTPAAIHQLGLDEVARIRGEMDKVKEQVGFKGDLNAFFNHVRTNAKLMPFTDPQEVIDNFNAIYQRVLPKVNELFALQPKTPFEVRRTEAFREASASAEYNPGAIDGSRPGIFYVPIRDVKTYNVHQDEDLFLHEAIPGHHFQISLQQENTLLPTFRKNLWYSAYGEGWALYTESLGKELGLYEDPYQYFGMLAAEMHRAIRLVVDTGLHAKGWTREQAIAYSLENESESEVKITSEIERYMANPGQALSYKIGQLKIIELRKYATEQLGDQFDIRKFHEIVLESGCIPLTLLEDKINAWIKAEQS